MRNSARSGKFPFVVSVVLARPLWWLALRTMRHLSGIATAAVVLAGGLGGGLPAAGPVAPPRAILVAQPAPASAAGSPTALQFSRVRLSDVQFSRVRLSAVRPGDVRLSAVRPGDVRLHDVRLGGLRLLDRLVPAPATHRAGPDHIAAGLPAVDLTGEAVAEAGSPAVARPPVGLPGDRRGSAVGRRAPPVA